MVYFNYNLFKFNSIFDYFKLNCINNLDYVFTDSLEKNSSKPIQNSMNTDISPVYYSTAYSNEFYCMNNNIQPNQYMSSYHQINQQGLENQQHYFEENNNHHEIPSHNNTFIPFNNESPYSTSSQQHQEPHFPMETSSNELYEFLPEEIFQLDQPIIKISAQNEPNLPYNTTAGTTLMMDTLPAPPLAYNSVSNINCSPQTFLDLSSGETIETNLNSYKTSGTIEDPTNYQMTYRTPEINNNFPHTSNHIPFHDSSKNINSQANHVNYNYSMSQQNNEPIIVPIPVEKDFIENKINIEKHAKRKFYSCKKEDFIQNNYEISPPNTNNHQLLTRTSTVDQNTPTIVFPSNKREISFPIQQPAVYYTSENHHLPFTSNSLPYMHHHHHHPLTTKSNLMEKFNCVTNYK